MSFNSSFINGMVNTADSIITSLNLSAMTIEVHWMIKTTSVSILKPSIANSIPETHLIQVVVKFIRDIVEIGFKP